MKKEYERPTLYHHGSVKQITQTKGGDAWDATFAKRLKKGRGSR